MEWKLEQLRIRMGVQPGNRNVSEADMFIWAKEKYIAETIKSLSEYEEKLYRKLFKHFIQKELEPNDSYRIKIEVLPMKALHLKKVAMYIDKLFIGYIITDYSSDEGAKVCVLLEPTEEEKLC